MPAMKTISLHSLKSLKVSLKEEKFCSIVAGNVPVVNTIPPFFTHIFGITTSNAFYGPQTPADIPLSNSLSRFNPSLPSSTLTTLTRLLLGRDLVGD